MIKCVNKSGPLNPNWKGGGAEIKCQKCGLLFHVPFNRKETAKCCSLSCWNAIQKEMSWLIPSAKKKQKPKPRKSRSAIRRPCIRCGQEFITINASKVYCGNTCKWASKTKVSFVDLGGMSPFSCENCRTDLFCIGKPRRFCSRSCKTAVMKGPKSAAWKGGLSDENMLIRSSPAYKEWRSLVFIRDRYTCKKCGQVGWDLHAHHIKKFSENPHLRFTVSNGITLCAKCHRGVHFKEQESEDYFLGIISLSHEPVISLTLP